MAKPYRTYDQVVVVRTVGGDEYRIAEAEGPSAVAFAEKIARQGAWITGSRTIFIPARQIAHIEVIAAEDFEKR